MTPRPSIRRALLGTGILVTALAGGAAAQGPSGAGPAVADGLDGTNWSLADGTAGATLAFIGDVAGGTGGCNQFSVPYTADAATLTFGSIVATRLACDESSMASEASYLAALSGVASYTVQPGAMTLTDGTGAKVLSFTAVPMPSVEGIWDVTGFDNGSTMTQPSASSGLTLAFGPDGRTMGNGGCNDYAGPYGVSEDQISIGPLMSTIKTCGETLDAQEQAYLDALQQAYLWAITADTLELRGYDGTVWVQAGRSIGH